MTHNSRLLIKGLAYRARHGYYEEERLEGNDFEVDLEFTLNLEEAARSDELGKTLNYEEAELIVREVMEGPSRNLIETLVFSIGENLFGQFPEVDRLEVKVRKLHPPLRAETDFSEVTMTWQRHT
ncbi:MAG: dihydroneopterin aldolase [Balneolaceae bacterium]|nr:dihydroneopterin aldolase [Balneolaceae bacterium]